MGAKRPDKPKRMSFNLSQETRRLLERTAKSLSTSGDTWTMTRIIEAAVQSWCGERLKQGKPE